MINAVVFLSVTGSLVYWITPHVFRYADQYLIRKRLAYLLSSNTPAESSNQCEKSLQETDWANVCDSVARFTRSGLSARDALSQALLAQNELWARQVDLLSQSSAVSDWLNNLALQHSNSDEITLLAHSLILGNFTSQALDHAARTLRDIRQCENEIHSGTAQAFLSARLLTLFPLGAICLGFMTNDAVRRGFFTPIVLISLLCGISLNALGWKWSSAIVSRIKKENSQQDIFSIADHVCVSLLAGMTIAQSLRCIPHTSDLAISISRSLEKGSPLVNSLEPLSQHPHEFARNFASLLLAADSDGQPVLTSVQQLSSEARLERRAITDGLIRQLPTQLTLPLVLCMLPSFLLCTLTPFLTVVLRDIMLPQLAT